MSDKLAELHVHLRGASSKRLLFAQAKKYPSTWVLKKLTDSHLAFFSRQKHMQAYLNKSELTEDFEHALFGYSNFEGFIASYLLSKYYFCDEGDLLSLINDVAESLKSQNITYAEITINPEEYLSNGIHWNSFCSTLESINKLNDQSIYWIMDIAQAAGFNKAEELVDRLLIDRPQSVIGLTIGGSEQFFPRTPCIAIYKKAKDAGLKLTVHAGETDGPESVWQAVKELHVDRIGHGVQSIKDHLLCEYLKKANIALEVCISSNIRTGVYSSIEEHPCLELFKLGVPITINTDDPSFFNTGLNQEYNLATKLGFSELELKTLKQNAWEYRWRK